MKTNRWLSILMLVVLLCSLFVGVVSAEEQTTGGFPPPPPPCPAGKLAVTIKSEGAVIGQGAYIVYEVKNIGAVPLEPRLSWMADGRAGNEYLGVLNPGKSATFKVWIGWCGKVIYAYGTAWAQLWNGQRMCYYDARADGKFWVDCCKSSESAIGNVLQGDPVVRLQYCLTDPMTWGKGTLEEFRGNFLITPLDADGNTFPVGTKGAIRQLVVPINLKADKPCVKKCWSKDLVLPMSFVDDSTSLRIQFIRVVPGGANPDVYLFDKTWILWAVPWWGTNAVPPLPNGYIGIEFVPENSAALKSVFIRRWQNGGEVHYEDVLLSHSPVRVAMPATYNPLVFYAIKGAVWSTLSYSVDGAAWTASARRTDITLPGTITVIGVK